MTAEGIKYTTIFKKKIIVTLCELSAKQETIMMYMYQDILAHKNIISLPIFELQGRFFHS